MTNVIAFRRDPRADRWREPELRHIVSALEPMLARAPERGWEVGSTEAGDPQFYLLLPEPEEACEICISRVGSVYVLEDNRGRVLFDGENLARLAEEAVAFLRRGRAGIVARAMLAWFGIRHFADELAHDRIEALMAEGEDMLVHVAPQLAALV